MSSARAHRALQSIYRADTGRGDGHVTHYDRGFLAGRVSCNVRKGSRDALVAGNSIRGWAQSLALCAPKEARDIAQAKELLPASESLTAAVGRQRKSRPVSQPVELYYYFAHVSCREGRLDQTLFTHYFPSPSAPIAPRVQPNSSPLSGGRTFQQRI